MKRCTYCGNQVTDNTGVCPHCLASDFVRVCDVCGADYVNGSCPACAERTASQQRAYEQAAKDKQEQDAIVQANSGLIWKSVLTFFLPCVGGYFLVKPGVKKGFTIYALVWTIAYTIIGLSGGAFNKTSLLAGFLAILILLGPVIYWLWLKLKALKT